MNKIFNIFLVGLVIGSITQVITDLRILNKAIIVEARILQAKK